MTRNKAYKTYLVFVMLVFAAKYFLGEYFFDLQAVPLLTSEPNWIFSVFASLELSQLASNSGLAIAFHTALLINCIVAFKFKNKVAFAVLNSFLLTCYYVVYTAYNPSQAHPLIAMVVLSFVFWTKKQETFGILLSGFRYFLLYALFSAGLFKIINGGFMYPLQFTSILKHQHIYELTHKANSWYANFIFLLLKNPLITELLYRIACFIQLSFVIGFFTKKYDHLLLIGFFSFFIGDLVFMKLSFFEMYIAAICLLNSQTMESISKKTSNLFRNNTLFLH